MLKTEQSPVSREKFREWAGDHYGVMMDVQAGNGSVLRVYNDDMLFPEISVLFIGESEKFRDTVEICGMYDKRIGEFRFVSRQLSSIVDGISETECCPDSDESEKIYAEICRYAKEAVVTEANGKVTLSDMPSGCYEVEETDVPAPYILDTNNRKTVWIDAEKDQDVVVEFVNSTKPGLRLMKIDQQTGEPLSGVQFRIREVNGSYNELLFTDKDGLIVLEGMNPGAYTIQETKPKNGWVADDTIHTVYLEENKTTTIELSNLRKPDLFVKKVDSVTGSPIEGVKFQIWRGSDDTKTGEYNDLGVFYTDAQGQIHLERQETGWYKIKELEPAPGYTIKQPDTQEIYMAAGKDYTVTFLV